MTVLADQRDAEGTQEPADACRAEPIARASVQSWRFEPLALTGPRVLLREVRVADASMLWYHLQSANLDETVGSMPPNVLDFERFIEWARSERANGRLLTYCVVDRDTSGPAGLCQAWPRSSDGLVAEWGFGIGCAYWGTGFFEEAAVLLIDDLFGVRCVQRLEALTREQDPRGAGALRKLGARRQGMDSSGTHIVWALLADEWPRHRGLSRPGGATPPPAEVGGRR